MNTTYEVDIAIFGSGIAGLWTYNVLKSKGYSVVLIEKNTLGGTQTIASQGMIHGGQRYTLQGALNTHSESISTMPKVWEECIEGKREPNLNETNVLAKNQYLWSAGGFSSNVTAFFASKAMNSRVNALEKEKWPKAFSEAKNFKGKIYELDELVLDIQSLAKNLANPYLNNVYKADEVEYLVDKENLDSVNITQESNTVNLKAKKYIFTAGKGNEEILDLLSPSKKLAQRRPLKQVMVKELDHPLYAHCITVDPRPRVTISSHPTENGKYVWYLGGLVAVNGIEKSDDEAIDFAKKELKTLFSWINWDEKQWSTFYIDRAEPYTSTGFLPEGPSIKEIANCSIVWPTKLTFAPVISEKILNSLKDIDPSNEKINIPLKQPEISNYPWDEATWQTA